jgi:hypothetical protein
MLTTTELETLAVMLHHAGKHMEDARDENGEYVWTAGDPTDPAHFTTAYNEILEGFYALQTDPWAELVHVGAGNDVPAMIHG